MFDVNDISTPIPGRFVCSCQTSSAKEAELIVAKFLIPVRMQYGFANLYNKGSMVYLDTPNFHATIEIGKALNNSINS